MMKLRERGAQMLRAIADALSFVHRQPALRTLPVEPPPLDGEVARGVR